MNTENLKNSFEKVAQSILKSNSLATHEDLELKKLTAFDFFTELFEDETLQAEYRIDDIAVVVLIFWDSQNKDYSEERIKRVLYEPVEKNYFLHYGKFLERQEAYEFVFHAVLIALEKNFELLAVFEDFQKQARKKMDLCPQIPMEQRNQFGLLSVIGLCDEFNDPAIKKYAVVMN
jgi:hypothetical protein